MHTPIILVISSVVCFLFVYMASKQNQQSSGPCPQGGQHALKRPLFTDISGAEEAVVRFATSSEVYWQNVSKYIRILNRMVSEVSNRMEASLNELNRDTVVIYRDITFLRQQVDLLSARRGESEGLYPQPLLMPPSVIRLVTRTQLQLIGGPTMASSGSSGASCPTVANVSLPQVTPLMTSSEAGQGNKVESCVSAAPEGPRPKEARPGFDASGQSSRRFFRVFSKETHPAQPSGQMSGPGPWVEEEKPSLKEKEESVRRFEGYSKEGRTLVTPCKEMALQSPVWN